MEGSFTSESILDHKKFPFMRIIKGATGRHSCWKRTHKFIKQIQIEATKCLSGGSRKEGSPICTCEFLKEYLICTWTLEVSHKTNR